MRVFVLPRQKDVGQSPQCWPEPEEHGEPWTVALSSPLCPRRPVAVTSTARSGKQQTTGIAFPFYPVSPVEDQVLPWGIEISVRNHFSSLIKPKIFPLKGALSGLFGIYKFSELKTLLAT